MVEHGTAPLVPCGCPVARSCRGTSCNQRDVVARTIPGETAVVASPMGRTMLPTAGTAGTSSTVVPTIQALVARTEDAGRRGSSRTGNHPLLDVNLEEYATASRL